MQFCFPVHYLKDTIIPRTNSHLQSTKHQQLIMLEFITFSSQTEDIGGPPLLLKASKVIWVDWIISCLGINLRTSCKLSDSPIHQNLNTTIDSTLFAKSLNHLTITTWKIILCIGYCVLKKARLIVWTNIVLVGYMVQGSLIFLVQRATQSVMVTL